MTSTGDNEPAGDGLRINAVAELAGLSAHTIRAWERRYGVPTPPRSTGGQRLYTRADVAALRRMSELSRNGVSLAVAARMVTRELEQETTISAADITRPGRADAFASFLEALLSFNEQRATEEWATYLGVSDVGTLLRNLAIPALQKIGDGWHEGTVTVAQEHFASSFIRSRLESLARQQPAPRGAPVVLLACLPDNWHEMSLLMLNVVLRFRGLRTVYLGQAVPADDLLRTVEDLQPAVVVLHGYDDSAYEQMEELVPRIAEAAPFTRVVYGGRPFENGHPLAATPATFGGRTIEEGVETIDALAREQR